MRNRFFGAALLAIVASAAALGAYIPKQDIHIKKEGLTTFKITGKNSWGAVDVKVEDKHLFQGFGADGKAGDKTVDVSVKSAGLAAGWKLEGKIGDMVVQGTCKQDGAFASTWTVKAKVGDRMIETKVDSEWEIDPAVAAVFVLFDCCEDAPKKDEPSKDAPKK